MYPRPLALAEIVRGRHFCERHAEQGLGFRSIINPEVSQPAGEPTMPQPLDPAVLAMIELAPPPPFEIPDPPPPLVELARAFRLRAAEPAPPPPFDGTIEAHSVPVRWGALPALLYRPSGVGERAPVAAFFHGGGFIAGDLDTHDPLCRELAVASRTLLLAVNYRLAPEHPFPAGLEDAYDATVWLAGAAAELGANPHRLAVAGDSA